MDAIFQVELISSKTKIGLNSNTFRNVPNKYTVKEINLYPGVSSTLASDKVYSGDFLMKAGINPNVNLKRTSVVLEVNEVK